MKECDVFRGLKHTLTPPTYFQGFKTPVTPMIYASCLSPYFLNKIDIDNTDWSSQFPTFRYRSRLYPLSKCLQFGKQDQLSSLISRWPGSTACVITVVHTVTVSQSVITVMK